MQPRARSGQVFTDAGGSRGWPGVPPLEGAAVERDPEPALPVLWAPRDIKT